MATESTSFTFIWMNEDDSLPPMEVMSFKGEEALGQPYSFDIELFAKGDGVKPKKMIGKNACLTLNVFGQERLFHGQVDACRVSKQLGEGSNKGLHYSLRLSPRFTRLKELHDNAVYIDQTLPDTLNFLLEMAGLSEEDYKTDQLQNYRKWSFRCQYGESPFNFLQRILEREGAYYYFEQKDDGEKIIFCDALSQHPEGDDEDLSLEYDPDSGGSVDPEQPEKATQLVYEWLSQGQRLPKKVILKDYNSETPSAEISGSEEVDPDGFGEVYRYADNLVDNAEAETLAEKAAELLLMKKEYFTARTQNPKIQPGQNFSLTGHFLDDGSYYPYVIHHQGHSADYFGKELDEGLEAYSNTMTCLQNDIQFRPEKETEKPRFYGILHGTVDGDEDDEYSAYLDEEGRYKVHLPFDRAHQSNSKQASCWMHRIQPTAGTGGSMHFPLLGGTEVAISFIGGDPDRPVIAGSLPNSAYPSQVTGDNKTQSIVKSHQENQILMDDQKDFVRLSLSSPIATTQMHLGSFDADNQGSLLTTDGVVRTLGRGGEINTLISKDYLAAKELDLKVDQSAEELIDQELFTFPRFKLDEFGNLEDDLTWKDELSGNYLVRRTAGNLYEWRDGPSYLFWNLNSPDYEFGNREINRYSALPSETPEKWEIPDCTGATWEPEASFVEKVWGDHYFYHKGNRFEWREEEHGHYIMGRSYIEVHPGKTSATPKLNTKDSDDSAPEEDDWLIHKVFGNSYRFIQGERNEITSGKFNEDFKDAYTANYAKDVTIKHHGDYKVKCQGNTIVETDATTEITAGAKASLDFSTSLTCSFSNSNTLKFSNDLDISFSRKVEAGFAGKFIIASGGFDFELYKKSDKIEFHKNGMQLSSTVKAEKEKTTAAARKNELEKIKNHISILSNELTNVKNDVKSVGNTFILVKKVYIIG